MSFLHSYRYIGKIFFQKLNPTEKLTFICCKTKTFKKGVVAMFINFTNHRSELWSIEQREAAEKYGEITDIAFPAVDPSFGSETIFRLAEKYAEMICSYKPDAVLVQGEMTLCYAVISILISKGINAVCATTERVTSTYLGQNGETVKKSEFSFVQFRSYG